VKAPIDDSPGGLAILLHAHHEPDGDEGGDDAMPEGLEDAAHDLMQAIHSGDAKAVAHALQDCYSMCQGEGDDAEKE